MRKAFGLFLIFLSILMLSACGQGDLHEKDNNPSVGRDWQDLVWEKSIELSYANQFEIAECGNYELITIVESGRFLLVKEGETIPSNLPEDVVVIHNPPRKVYLCASSAFDPISRIDSIKNVTYSGIKESDLYIEAAVEAYKAGNIKYAGKYSAPDFEMLTAGGCDLAIESTMIFHNPQIKEKLEDLGIPVLVERSSYETNPIGRLEWIKLYGVLFDKKEEANTFFEEEKKKIEEAVSLSAGKDEPVIAFFHVNSNGVINVRKPADYIVKLIELAGGKYALDDLKNDEENSLSTLNIQMEDFYLKAKDADVLIYNSTIVGEIKSIDELIEKNALFADFKAVKNKRVYCTEKNFFQETTGMANLLMDFYSIVCNSGDESFYYLNRLE